MNFMSDSAKVRLRLEASDSRRVTRDERDSQALRHEECRTCRAFGCSLGTRGNF